MKQEITLQLKANEVGEPPFEFPAYAMNAYLTKDGKIWVTAVVITPTGRAHIIQDIIEPPTKEQS